MAVPLFERYPGTESLRLAGIPTMPTPIDEVAGFGPDAPVGGLAVKRDDLTNRFYGGNKPRKLDFLLGDALAQGAKSVLTFGAYGSNHALATAVHARALGLEPHVVLSPQEPGPYAPATLLAHAGLGTHIHLVDGWDGRREAVLAKRELLERDGVEPYVIPMGGTCPLGALGYVNAALEIAEQVAYPPDALYVATGTLGTAVGLAIGFAAVGSPTNVVAVRVTPAEICNLDIARDLAEKTIELLRARDESFPEMAWGALRFELRDDWFEPGYGVVTSETAEAVELGAQRFMKLETTYTGKALAALLADARAGLLGEQRVLFLDTYSSAPKPAPGRLEDLPRQLQEYIAECEARFGEPQ